MVLHNMLKEKFGFDTFRPGQEEVIHDVIHGKDTLAIFPTGNGKSLCYQLPAYMMDGVVLIISPLVALMEDQVSILKMNGEKRVAALNSFYSYRERNRVLSTLNQYKFIFISPEMLNQKHVAEKLVDIPIAFIVVDEAHCISQWGFDFRPDYLRIGEFLKQLEQPKILALTATADDQVISDIVQFLHLNQPSIHKQSLDRPEISYAIVQLDQPAEKENWIIERVKTTTGPGIIYVSSRKRADELSQILSTQGIQTAAYHAGMEQTDRALTQEQFIQNEIDWICATNAFGMGIHKNNIRQVIHEHFPSTVAAYMQEVGRAGRDKKPSATTLLYSAYDEEKTRFIVQEDIPHEGDIRTFYKLVEEGETPQQIAETMGLSDTSRRVISYYLERMSVEETIQQIQNQRNEKEHQMQKMLQIIHSDQCIRKLLLSYFGEYLGNQYDNCCSRCGLEDQKWLIKEKGEPNFQQLPLNWKERLQNLLG